MWSSSFWIAYILYEGFCTIPWKISAEQSSPKPNYIPFKITLRAVQNTCFELCSACFSLVRISRDQSSWKSTYLCSTAVSGLACDSYRKLRFILWLFTSCVWDNLRYWISIKTAFDLLETCSSSFCNECNRFHDFRTNLPKETGYFTESKTQTFQNDVKFVP